MYPEPVTSATKIIDRLDQLIDESRERTRQLDEIIEELRILNRNMQ